MGIFERYRTLANPELGTLAARTIGRFPLMRTSRETLTKMTAHTAPRLYSPRSSELFATIVLRQVAALAGSVTSNGPTGTSGS
jgi:hypothetical protein